MRGTRRVLASAGVAALALAPVVADGRLGGHGTRDARGSVDTAAVAVASTPGTVAEDESWDMVRASGRHVTARNVSVGTASCPGCTTSATAVQVLSAERPRTLRAANAATASAACDGCRSSTVSVQVVLTRTRGSVTADNTALAVNAGCSGCETAAAAYQLVVVDPRGRGLSRHARAEVEQLVAEILGMLEQPEKAAVRQAPQGLQTAQRDGGAADVAVEAMGDRLVEAVAPLEVSSVDVDLDRTPSGG